jgi:hypothetical protein
MILTALLLTHSDSEISREEYLDYYSYELMLKGLRKRQSYVVIDCIGRLGCAYHQCLPLQMESEYFCLQ